MTAEERRGAPAPWAGPFFELSEFTELWATAALWDYGPDPSKLLIFPENVDSWNFCEIP